MPFSTYNTTTNNVCKGIRMTSLNKTMWLVAFLFSISLNSSRLCGANEQSRSLFHLPGLLSAIEEGNVYSVQRMIALGAPVNAESKDVWRNIFTPLSLASARGHLEIVKLLLANGAYDSLALDRAIRIASYNETHKSLSDAIMAPIFTCLLEVGIQPSGEQRILCDAITQSYQSIIPILLERGASVNKPNHNGETPLWCAKKCKNNDAIVTLLLENGADINLENRWGITPTKIAITGCTEDEYRRIRELLAEAKKNRQRSSNNACALS